MKHKQQGKQASARNTRPWEKKDPSESHRARLKEELGVTEGIALYALMTLEGRKDKKGAPLATSDGLWEVIRKEFGTDIFSAGLIRNALDMLEGKGMVTSHTRAEIPESKAQSANTYYRISETMKPEKATFLMQQAIVHWKREKELAGKS